MRYLSKIIFINSADKSLKYAEIDLDGNVHFIGTQGVGKSTLLRAILFFYNADTQKLGIPREKKNYNEYYFPYQNSYIVYEIQTETKKFCVATFKSQGRVAFRFFDAEYNKKFFIDNDGKAYESWDKIRLALGKIDSSRIINNYEEYRNILYGNNRGLAHEFKKYALLESKQYQNIPRTISNVFLNTKLDAEFVKETIIKSLNEDEVNIDLTTYSQTHLKDFETNLNDIKKWNEGIVIRQAEKVIQTFVASKFLENTKRDLALQLGYALSKVKEQLPKVQKNLEAIVFKRDGLTVSIKRLSSQYSEKKSAIQVKIGEVSGKLNDIKNKRDYYISLKIDTILERVSKKPNLDLEKENLLKEREILTLNFQEINQRFEAQLKQIDNQFKEFENVKNGDKNNANSSYINFKDELNKQYELKFEEIRKQHKNELDTANVVVKDKTTAIYDNRIKFHEISNKRFYYEEIKNVENNITKYNTDILDAEAIIQKAESNIKYIKRDWEIEEDNAKAELERKIKARTEEQEKLKEQIAKIDSKIENSKDSLYGWLNDNMPNWESTIGKVIDEEHVLFKQGLRPKQVPDANSSFYGIAIDTSEIRKSVKTVADLKQDQDLIRISIQEIQQTIHNLKTENNVLLEKFRKKFQGKISEQKEIAQQAEYKRTISKSKVDENKLLLGDLQKKAADEQKSALQKIEIDFAKLSEEKSIAVEKANKIEQSIDDTINQLKKEKEQKIKFEEDRLIGTLKSIEGEILEARYSAKTKSDELKIAQKNELDTKGADTKRLGEIALKIDELTNELNFIAKNISITERYKYDKEQLFDKEDEFNISKLLFEKELENESEKHKHDTERLSEESAKLNIEIEALTQQQSEYQSDLSAYENFVKSDVYQSVKQYDNSFTIENSTTNNCRKIINDLYTNDSSITKRYIELQESINKFTGNFQESNLFRFKVKFTERAEYFDFAEMLKEFIDENKVDEYRKRVEERFAHIIRQIGRETQTLIEKEGEIGKIINEINNDFVTRNFVGAIKSMELKTEKSANSIYQLLVDIKTFNDENTFDLGSPDLFSTDTRASKNEKAISLLKQLIKEMNASKVKEITLSDSFELMFKVVENDNDTGWVEKLTNVGSEGTDVLVKAMINIMLLNVFKERASKRQKDDFRLHCMMDEIGKLHPTNVKGILQFANDRNILLINSSPTSLNAADYRYTYLLSKDNKNVTNVKRLIKKISKMEG